MAIKAGVNANQLRCWIEQHKAEQKDFAGTMDVIESASAAFVPLVGVHAAGRQAEPGRPTLCLGQCQCLCVRCNRPTAGAIAVAAGVAVAKRREH